MKTSTSHLTRISRGFTLVEILVVIAIIAALAAITASVVRNVMHKAQLAKVVNGMKQCGDIIVGDTMDYGGQIAVFRGGNGHGAFKLQEKVANFLGYDTQDYANRPAILEVISSIAYTPAYIPETWDNGWGAYGINIDDNEEMGVKWKAPQTEDAYGNKGTVGKINADMVDDPSSYPLIADSSNADGKPRLRFGNGNNYKFALRYNQKGVAVFLDGSTRIVTQKDLKGYGITHAYLFENGPKDKPTLITTE